MKSRTSKVHHDSIQIPSGLYVELYSPATGQIISPSLNQRIAYCKIHLNADCTISFRDARGNAVVGMAVKQGPLPYLVTELSSVSAGTAFIIHDGLVDQDTFDMTSDLYQTVTRNG